MSYETWHWRVYNIFRRVFSLGFVAFGIASCAGAASEVLMPTPGNGRPIVWFAIGIVTLLVGLALCRRPTFRPDLGDRHWWERMFGRSEPADPHGTRRRSWWTGDPDVEDA